MHPLAPLDLYAGLPLDTERREIRVLDLDAAREKDAPLRGSLRVASLAECPQFTALSYVWGEPAKSREFEMELNNNRTIALPYNCFQALKHLRPTSGRLTIWVDSVCINQVDKAEKAAQIPLMGEIYTWAERVYIWLGDGDEDSDWAIDWIWWNSHHRLCLAPLPLVTNPSLRSRLTAFCRLPVTLLLPYFYLSMPPAFFDSLAFIRVFRFGPPPVMEHGRIGRMDLNILALKLLSRPWFQRAWTFQELILAWDPVFVCGNKKLNWDTLVRGTHRIRPTMLTRGHQRDSSKLGSLTLEDLNGKAESVLALFYVWMDLPRPTMWNGWKKRNAFHTNEEAVSASGYQTLLRQRYTSRWLMAIITILYHLLGFSAMCMLIVGVPVILCLQGAQGPGSIFPYMFPAALISAVGILPLFGFIRHYVHIIKHHQITAPWLPGPAGMLQNASEDPGGLGKDGRMMTKAVAFCTSPRPDPIRLDAQPGELSVALDGVIRALRHRRATNAVDRAFALHGVIAALKIPRTQVKYSDSSEVVYEHLLADLLRWDPASVFTIMDARPTLPGRPSWVPDWNRIPDDGWVHDSCFDINEVSNGQLAQLRRIGDVLDKITESEGFGHEAFEQGDISEHVNATRGSVPNVRVDGGHLIVHGYPMDYVKWASGYIPMLSEMDFYQSAPPFGSPVFQLLEDLLLWMHHIRLESTSDQLAAAVWSVLHPRWRVAADPMNREFKELFRLLTKCASRLADISPAKLEKATALLYEAVRNSEEARHVLIEICGEMVGKRGLFFTDKGRMGTGAPEITTGDKVSLICGVPVPMILRRVASVKRQYHVIGPSFVEGAMYGKLFEKDKVRKLVLA